MRSAPRKSETARPGQGRAIPKAAVRLQSETATLLGLRRCGASIYWISNMHVLPPYPFASK